MKSLNFFVFFALLVWCVNAKSQSALTDTVYYKYELISTSEYSESGDTLYDVYFILNDEDLPKLNSLIILKNSKEKNISLSEKAIDEDPWFEKKAKTLKIKIDKWPNLTDLLVIGLNDESEQIILLDAELKKKKSSNEIDTIIIPVKRTRPPIDKEKNTSNS